MTTRKPSGQTLRALRHHAAEVARAREREAAKQQRILEEAARTGETPMQVIQRLGRESTPRARQREVAAAERARFTKREAQTRECKRRALAYREKLRARVLARGDVPVES